MHGLPTIPIIRRARRTTIRITAGGTRTMRNLNAVLMAFAVLGMGGTANHLAAQADEDDVIVRQAVAALRGPLVPAGEITIDPRAFTPVGSVAALRSASERSVEWARRAADAIGGAAVRQIDDNVVCGDHPSTCSLRQGVAALAISRPEVSGSRAVVYVRTHFKSDSEHQPVAVADLRVLLSKAGENWTVEKVVTLRRT